MFPSDSNEPLDTMQYLREMPGIAQPPAVNPRLKFRGSESLGLEGLWEGLTSGDRRSLSQAITLLESTRPEHQAMAHSLVERAMDRPSQTARIGFTGVPGVGKSTLIEAMGLTLLDEPACQLAVLAIDPSSAKSGGSILGDKSRMQELARHPRSFIRPSPARGSLGGVTFFTREAILLCEAAGATHVFVETVGVGQSEVALAGMVDLFVVLMLAGAGDELQGIKRGILELADTLVVTKADLQPEAAALAAHQLRMAIPMLRGVEIPVHTVSAHSAGEVTDLVEALLAQIRGMGATVELADRRADQRVQWARDLIDAKVRHFFATCGSADWVWEEVRRGEMTPQAAAERWWSQTGL